MNIEMILDIITRPMAWAWIRKTHLDDKVTCPICGAVIAGSRALASFTALERTYCVAHGSTFQAKSAVPQLRGTEWAPEEYVKLRLLHLAQMPPAAIARLLGKSPSCIRNMLDRCQALEGPFRPGPSFLAGSIE